MGGNKKERAATIDEDSGAWLFEGIGGARKTRGESSQSDSGLLDMKAIASAMPPPSELPPAPAWGAQVGIVPTPVRGWPRWGMGVAAVAGLAAMTVALTAGMWWVLESRRGVDAVAIAPAPALTPAAIPQVQTYVPATVPAAQPGFDAQSVGVAIPAATTGTRRRTRAVKNEAKHTLRSPRPVRARTRRQQRLRKAREPSQSAAPADTEPSQVAATSSEAMLPTAFPEPVGDPPPKAASTVGTATTDTDSAVPGAVGEVDSAGGDDDATVKPTLQPSARSMAPGADSEGECGIDCMMKSVTNEAVVLPQRPSKTSIRKSIALIRSRVASCGLVAGMTGAVRVKFTIKPDGRVRSLRIPGADSDMIRCVAPSVRESRFDPSQKGATIRYKITIGAE